MEPIQIVRARVKTTKKTDLLLFSIEFLIADFWVCLLNFSFFSFGFQNNDIVSDSKNYCYIFFIVWCFGICGKCVCVCLCLLKIEKKNISISHSSFTKATPNTVQFTYVWIYQCHWHCTKSSGKYVFFFCFFCVSAVYILYFVLRCTTISPKLKCQNK